jgi:GAF domain-containing protein
MIWMLMMTDVVDRFGALPGEPWAENPRSAILLPILSSNKGRVECLLVARISPRLPFNSEYRSLLELVAQQVESSIATAHSYEAEHKRAKALAELDRAKTAFFSNVSHELRSEGVEEWRSRGVEEWRGGKFESVQYLVSSEP